MTSGGLLPRTGSSCSIHSLDSHAASSQQQWQHGSSLLFSVIPNGRKYSKPSVPDSRERILFRLPRIITGRRVGMFVAALMSLFSLLMLLNGANRTSTMFRSIKDKGALGLISKGRLTSEMEKMLGGNSTIFLSPNNSGFISEAFPQQDNHKMSWPVQSSEQPFPDGHPCQGFRLPPPPSDKKRTGPRPCPVCYLPVKEAIWKMPRVVPSPIPETLSYATELPSHNFTGTIGGSEFGGHPSLEERNNYFMVRRHMNIHCGFVKGSQPGAGTGFDIAEDDRLEMSKCTGIVVASAIFGNYDLLQRPRSISLESRRTVCFFMFVDEETRNSISKVSASDENGLWRVVLVQNLPYSDARRNGKIPKLLLHRLFPNAKYSLWIDGKLQLVEDPYRILERFLWRKNHSLAISQHYRRYDVFEEAEANRAARKYDNATIDAQVNFYRKEGLQHYDASRSSFPSDVPEGCVIIREHTPITNLFTCLWFNEVDRFTSRDQLSFAIVRDKLMKEIPLRLSMFLDCERRNFVVQAYHRDVLEFKRTITNTHSTNTTMRALDNTRSNATNEFPLRTAGSKSQHPRRGRRSSKRSNIRYKRRVGDI